MEKQDLTLGLAVKDNKILLGLKKRGFGEGKWNGYGGKLLEGETLEEALIREVKEEAVVKIRTLEKIGYVEFSIENDPIIKAVHIYRISIEGDPKETEEMKPQWFHLDQIPYDDMWSSDRLWYPYFLSNQKFIGTLTFKENKLDISHHSFQKVFNI